jgi:hypothetical protein
LAAGGVSVKTDQLSRWLPLTISIHNTEANGSMAARVMAPVIRLMK